MTGRLNGLDLFSGIGGNTLALNRWVKTVAYCDFDRHSQAVLLSRMYDGSLEAAPIWNDVTTLGRDHFNVPVDIIVGGFPCQDLSVAGKGAGLAGERSGLVFEIFRLIQELQPTFVFLENVPAIRTRGGERVVKELASLGYDCRWDCLSAYDVGAPHKRERWFLLAYRNRDGQQIESQRDGQQIESQRDGAEPQGCGSLGNDVNGLCDAVPNPQRNELRNEQGWSSRTGGEGTPQPRVDGSEQSLANPNNEGLEGRDGGIMCERSGERTAGTCGGSGNGRDWWEVEPDVGRVVDGVPYRVDRLKRLGNAVVPAQAREAFCRLMGIKEAL